MKHKTAHPQSIQFSNFDRILRVSFFSLLSLKVEVGARVLLRRQLRAVKREFVFRWLREACVTTLILPVPASRKRLQSGTKVKGNEVFLRLCHEVRRIFDFP